MPTYFTNPIVTGLGALACFFWVYLETPTRKKSTARGKNGSAFARMSRDTKASLIIGIILTAVTISSIAHLLLSHR